VSAVTIYRAGDELIEVSASDRATVEFLDSFLDRAPNGHPQKTSPLATITVTDDVLGTEGRVHGTVALSRDGRDYRIGRRSATVALDRGEALGVLRKLIRVIWLAHQAPAGDYFYLHASAVDDGRDVVVFTGDKRGGKTTLMLDAVHRHGFSLLTNDGLLIARSGPDLVMSPMPTLAKIRGDVAERFWPFLTTRAVDRFNAAQLTSWRDAGLPKVDEDPLFLTFGALGRKFDSIRLTGRRVLVVGVQFGNRGDPVQRSPLLSTTDAGDLVTRNRKDLTPTFGAMVGFVPSTPERERRLVEDLVAGVAAVRFVHAGETGPVLGNREPRSGTGHW
jgi:hypothetical protein